MMMKNLFRTVSKTPNFLNSPTPNRIYPFSLPSFSTNEQHPNLQSHIDQNHEIEITKMKTLSKPSQIPYQSKVANWVNLIGTIQMPIKFLTCVNGKSWAATLISQQQKSSNSLPLGYICDLAYTAMMHLKENDVVHIDGHLSPEPVPISFANNQANFQVLVHDVHFVRGLDRMEKRFFRR
ncbi:protein OSB2, chloroplastic-like isoform X2 [Silene latifolia]|uniref:protein OSB2, chloroplastic-like isoform X2 n=1 Tax=Silene latifolia TaxID=37657 RepID=UPI003D786659